MTYVRICEVRPRKDRRGVDLISDALPFGRLWYGEPDAINNAIDYAKFRSRSHRAVIRVYDETGKCDRNAQARGRVQRAVNSLFPSRSARRSTMRCCKRYTALYRNARNSL
jgi:hypothetical protein